MADTASLTAALRTALRAGELTLPFPAEGHTGQRHQALYQFGVRDLSFARLAEAHSDALAILHEARRAPKHDALYGVWASDGPDSRVIVSALPSGWVQLNGRKGYCSGAALLDVALITAREGGCVQLFELPLATPGIEILATDWASPAFAATATHTLLCQQVNLPPSARVGGPNWYLERIGFWHGALGPAACWAGGAAGLVQAARRSHRKNPHALAQLGALESAEWNLLAMLAQAGQQIDVGKDAVIDAHRRALIVRHLIERCCVEVIDRFGRATGPQLLAFDGAVAQRSAELQLYVRQCHAEKDLENLAGL